MKWSDRVILVIWESLRRESDHCLVLSIHVTYRCLACATQKSGSLSWRHSLWSEVRYLHWNQGTAELKVSIQRTIKNWRLGGHTKPKLFAQHQTDLSPKIAPGWIIDICAYVYRVKINTGGHIPTTILLQIRQRKRILWNYMNSCPIRKLPKVALVSSCEKTE